MPISTFYRCYGLSDICAGAQEIVSVNVSKGLIEDIYQIFKSSVSLPIAPDSDAARMFKLVLAEGRGLVAKRNEIEAQAGFTTQGDPNPFSLLSLYIQRIARRIHDP